MRALVFVFALGFFGACVGAPDKFAPADAGTADGPVAAPFEWVVCGEGSLDVDIQDGSVVALGHEVVLLASAIRTQVCAVGDFHRAEGTVTPTCLLDEAIDVGSLASGERRGYAFSSSCQTANKHLTFYELDTDDVLGRTCVDWQRPGGFDARSLAVGKFKADGESSPVAQVVAATTMPPATHVESELHQTVLDLTQDAELARSGQGDSDCLIATTSDGFYLCEDLSSCAQVACEGVLCGADEFAFSDGTAGAIRVAALTAGAVDVVPVDGLRPAGVTSRLVEEDALWVGWASWATCANGAVRTEVDGNDDLIVVRSNVSSNVVVSVFIDALNGERDPEVCDHDLEVPTGGPFHALVAGDQLWIVGEHGQYWRLALFSPERCGRTTAK